ncbi:MAG: Uma2 family endonuclease [Tepidisphaeraceae bacterium]
MGVFEGERVQLIDGEIVRMATQKDVHAVAVGLTSSALRAAFGSGVWVREQLPIRIGTYSEPEPDVSVVAGEPRDYVGTDHPDRALLVVEISDTTLSFDRKQKASLYASAGIADYWIVNLIDRTLELHRGPIANPSSMYGHRYASVTAISASGELAPLAAPSAIISVADLLP